NRGALVEVNCETDFVAKDESFKEFANDVAKAVVVNRPANLEQLSESQISVDQTVEERRKEIIAKLGENMTIRRFEYYETENQLTSYMHGNRIGVIVEFQGDEPTARDIAMHVAASRPQCVSSDQVDEELIEKERHIYTEQAAESGKPAEIIAKMVDGRLKKFLAEITLLGQQFVKNPDQTVEQLLKENDSKVIDFTVYHVGEGLEKKVTDYAAEVAAAAKV
ncbi:MAG: translation elongation factor Ts, partial [Neisseriaceae bacterium]|nr:translation elongation factor Ts [Neisseriaceae bacterium]